MDESKEGNETFGYEKADTSTFGVEDFSQTKPPDADQIIKRTQKFTQEGQTTPVKKEPPNPNSPGEAIPVKAPTATDKPKRSRTDMPIRQGAGFGPSGTKTFNP